MPPPIEILIHPSAPSHGPDDVRYRKEVLGYLNFEVNVRHDVLVQKPELEESQSKTGSSTRQEDADRGHILPVELDEEGEPLPSSQFSLLPDRTNSSPFQQSSPSPLPKPSALHRLQRQNLDVLQVAGTAYSPRVLVGRTPNSTRPRTAPTAASNATSHTPLRRTQSDSWETPPSVIADSQPSFSSLKRNRIGSPTPEQSLPNSPSPKRQRRLSPQPAEPPVPASEATQSPAAPPACPFLVLPAYIYAPPPKSSTQSFSTHLTPSLTLIKTKLPNSLFAPLSTSRPLRPSERGHWVLPLHKSWPADLKVRLWDFLTAFIGEARAGWGVWCVLEGTGKGKAETAGNVERNTEEGAEGEVLEIYCWGQTVEHIYLLLFLASERRVKGCGARWIDGAGKMVVQMA
ncbi:hypothetical protein MMC12_004560 [Toensbergia leucococca]|nr:hypothetical protein [Toensbergia leucococca]